MTIFKTDRLEEALKSLLRGEHSSLSITHNDHSSNYYTAREAKENGDFEVVRWASAEEEKKALTTNSVWLLHWYPDTPIGFCCVGASSLEAVIRAALEAK